MLDWLKVEFEIEKPSMRLQLPERLNPEEFITEVKKSRGRGRALTSAALGLLRDEYGQITAPVRRKLEDMPARELRLHAMICEAYGLAATEEKLIWVTAPPRMPAVGRPTSTKDAG
jgi:hypothetical protein